MRLSNNESKTKFMVIGLIESLSQVLIGVYTFEAVQQFFYLGCQVNVGNDVSEEYSRGFMPQTNVITSCSPRSDLSSHMAQKHGAFPKQMKVNCWYGKESTTLLL